MESQDFPSSSTSLTRKTETLRDKFITWLVNTGTETFTTKDALWWYQQNKLEPNKRADYANLYTLILNPLESGGIISRYAKGIWHIVPSHVRQIMQDAEQQDKDLNVSDVNQQPEDEFERYIQSKIKEKGA